MDGLTMRRLANELGERFSKSKIEKIHQPSDRDLVLTLRVAGQPARRLLLSAHKQFARMHFLVDERPENPMEPPMFCMRLRKHLEGGRIVAIQQHSWDRVLELQVEAMDEVGDLRTYFLICELMGRHSNIILCRQEDGALRIIDAIVRVTEQMSRHREVVPGAPYIAPPAQDKTPMSEITAGQLMEFDREHWLSRPNVQLLVAQIAGIGPTSAREILHRAQAAASHSATETAVDHICQVTRWLGTIVEQNEEAASVALDNLGRAMECAPFLLTHKTDYAPCPSMSEAIRRRFADTGEVLYHSHLQDELHRVVFEHLDKLRGKQIKLQQSLTESEDEHIYRVKAELLTAFAHQIKKGESRCVVPNYYEDNQLVAIDLNPALDAIQNAQYYYKQASKRKRASTSVAEQLAVTENDIRYLEAVDESLHNASLANLELIRRELLQQGFLQEKPTKRKKPVKAEKIDNKPDVYTSVDGFVMRVGRNNLQNDKLTLRQSDGSDIWLHVKDQPGSHVVIRRDGSAEIPQETLEEAALLAAYFSRGRDSANVPVDFTEVRHIWKPNGARPGLVLYDHQRTLFVTPERALVEPILSRSNHDLIKAD